MRSVEVVFPASICAMIPMLRVCSSCTLRAIKSPCGLSLSAFPPLPAIVRESLVGFGHAVHVFFPLHRAPSSVGGLQHPVRELIHHALARPGPCVQQQPANCERLPPELAYLDGHLVVGAAYAP